jgi:hypothetical protein
MMRQSICRSCAVRRGSRSSGSSCVKVNAMCFGEPDRTVAGRRPRADDADLAQRAQEVSAPGDDRQLDRAPDLPLLGHMLNALSAFTVKTVAII